MVPGKKGTFEGFEMISKNNLQNLQQTKYLLVNSTRWRRVAGTFSNDV